MPSSPIELKEVFSERESSEMSDVRKALEILPQWVKPKMVYHQNSVTKQEILGHGFYGIVYRAAYSDGSAK